MFNLFFALAELLYFLARLLPMKWVGPSTSRWLAAELEEASREQGIRFEPRSSRSATAMGTWKDFSVLVKLQRRGMETDDEKSLSLYLNVRITGPRIPQGITLAAVRGTGGDMLTGDTAGELLYRAPADVAPGELVRVLRLGLWLARELSSPGGGVCERLARNARSDPQPGVRLLNLLQLHEQFPEKAEAREASQEDLKDPSPWVRLAAARFLKDEGLAVLEQLVQDRAIPESAAAEALTLLAARYPAQRAGPLLATALKMHSGEARRQAVEELGRIRYGQARGPLRVLLEHADPRTGAAAAAALAALGDVKAETTLLKAVESDARELRLAAIRALGMVGSAASVEPLLSFLASRRLDAETSQVIRSAIGAIQSRLAGAGAGQLSLAATPPGSGWLSVARPGDEHGQLSLVCDQKKG